jgi:hypothetical protein
VRDWSAKARADMTGALKARADMTGALKARADVTGALKARREGSQGQARSAQPLDRDKETLEA